MNKKPSAATAVLLAAAMLFTAGCAKEGTSKGNSSRDLMSASVNSSENSGSQDGTSSNAPAPEAGDFSDTDLDDSWSQDDNQIELSGDSATVTGSGASVSDGIITISQAGTYVISGTLNDGQIIVDTGDNDKVKLVLNGAALKCLNSSPIYVQNADKVVITLAAGTENTVADGENYVYTDVAEEEPDSVIFSKDDLTINGSGSLTVNASFNDGIKSKDDLKIAGGSITVSSIDDGIMGKDSVQIIGADITVLAEGDGIKSTEDTDAEKGFIVLETGNYTITSESDAIQAETGLTITGGTFNLITGGGSANASTQTGGGWGMWGGNTSTDDTSDSAKAIKAGGDIQISGGSFTIDSSDDSVHSNANISVSGGEFAISSGDDGIHADTSLTIEDGNILISQSYEALESASITINGGEIDVTASDDGINVAGGADSSAMGGRPGQNSFTESGSYLLTISGGTIYMDASGDGLDSNGSIVMTGGTVIVNGPTDSGNGALDYNSSFTLSGGLLVASGSSGMAQNVSPDSGQCSVLLYTGSIEAGTVLSLQDSGGNEIVTFSPTKAFQCIAISSPDLVTGKDYTLYNGGASTGTEKGGLYTGGSYSGGSGLITFTLSSTVQTAAADGVSTGGMGGGFGGGMQQGGGRGSRN